VRGNAWLPIGVLLLMLGAAMVRPHQCMPMAVPRSSHCHHLFLQHFLFSRELSQP